MTTLSQLEHLLALDETRHFAKAANKVHLSQPAFSRSIQALERNTGLVLFERNGGDIRPTPAGKFLIERARQVVLENRAFQRDVQLFQAGDAGDLAFGVGPFPGATLAASVLTQLRLQHPRVSVRMEVGNQAMLLALLLKEEIEFFVADTRQITQAPYLEMETLMKQYGHLYARQNHPLGNRPHTFVDAWEYGIASVKLPEEIKAGLASLMKQESRATPRLAFECDDTHLLHQLALCTNTVVASTELAVQPWLATKELVLLNTVDFPALFANISIVSLKNRMFSPAALHAVEKFRAFKDISA